MRRMLGVVLLAAGLLIATGSAAARASSPSELSLPGPAFFPESITAAPGGALFVSSLVTGEIVRFAPGSSEPTTFVARTSTSARRESWPTPSAMCSGPAPSISASKLHRSCAHSTCRRGPWWRATPCPTAECARTSRWHGGDVYVTDTLGGRIVRLTETKPGSAEGGTLAVWSADPQLAGGAVPEDQRHRVRRKADALHHQLQHRRAVRRPHRARWLRRASRADRARHADDQSRRHPVAWPIPLRRREPERAVTHRPAQRDENPDRQLARSAHVARIRWP